MNAILNYISRIFSPVTVGDALADLDKAVAKLEKAEANHSKKVDQFNYQAEVAITEAARHEYAAVRSARVRKNLADLIG